jgi:hypothetical protein
MGFDRAWLKGGTWRNSASSDDKQEQRAGRGSQQVQAGRDIVNVYNVYTAGDAQAYLDESRDGVLARELSSDALPVAASRVVDFDSRLVKRLVKDDLLEELRNPGYQLALNKARISAGASERDGDIDTLVELLGVRASRDDRKTRASVAKAVEIVDDVDDTALEGLTLYVGGALLMPGALHVEAFLSEWAEAIGRVPRTDLPVGIDWLEHLHILGAIRLDTSNTHRLSTMSSWIGNARPGFLSPGFPEADKAEVIEACALHLGENSQFFTKHEFKTGFSRSLFSSESQLRYYYGQRDVPAHSLDNVVEILKTSAGFAVVDPSVKSDFMDRFNSYSTLAVYENWRSTIKHPIYVTHVGKALVWASLQKSNIACGPFRDILHS